MTPTEFLASRTLIIGFGAHKSGTTWVAQYLRRHPQVFVSSIKEMHFFRYYPENGSWPRAFFERQLALHRVQIQKDEARVRDISERLEFGHDTEKYVQFFSSRMAEQTHFCDLTPAYSMLPEAELARIKAQFPNVRPFFLLRNPADRFWSQVRFNTGLLENQNPDQVISQTLSDRNFKFRSDYRTSILRLRNVFGANVHIEFFENFLTEPGIKKFCAFVGIPFMSPDLTKRVNDSPKHHLNREQRRRLVRALSDQYTFCHAQYGANLPPSWCADMELL